MSLISARNFTAPFEKRWQLFTMLTVTLLFALLRLTMARTPVYPVTQPAAFGSSAYAPPVQQRPVPPPAEVAPAVQEAPPARAVARPTLAPPSFEGSRQSVMQELFGGEEVQKTEEAPRPAEQRGGLDDIEAKLGLR